MNRQHLLTLGLALGWIIGGIGGYSSAQARPQFRYPMTTSGTYITAYYDNDRGSGLRDWNGGTKTYDNHSGSDYGIGGFSGMDQGVWIYAGADGVVDAAVDGNADRCTSGTCSPANGNYVRLSHSDGLYTYYLHMKKGTVQVKVGQQVKCGQQLGMVGSSGYSTGPHLHFQVNTSSARDPFLNSDWVNRGSYLGHPSTTCQTSSPPPPPPPPPASCTHVQTYRLGGVGLNIRSGSSTSYGVLGSIPEGKCVKVDGVDNNGQDIYGDKTWYKVTYNGVTGWISGYYAQCSTCGGPAPECTDGQTRSCYTGAADTRNKGICKDGKQSCSGGKWQSTCTGQTLPANETCDGQDNNCNGQTDEGNPGGGQYCKANGTGACGDGTTVCENGKLVCKSSTPSSPEVCDGKDNNCNGQIDEGNPGGGKSCNTGQSGACSTGSTQCVNGKEICQPVGQPSQEICDNQDNDCNGQIDDGLSRNCYTGSPNTNGVGPCRGGKQICIAGNWGTCQGEVLPAAQETCGNNIDDNCNGTIDEGCGSTCTTGQTQPCYTGPPNTRNVGNCREGVQQCVNGSWTVCQGETLPTAQEVCGNGKDDNCNGIVDENCNNPQGTCEDKDGDGYGVGDACKGIQDCDDNNKAVRPGGSEICGNGIDEDCDGRDLPCGKLQIGEEGCKEPGDCESNFCVKLGDVQRCSKKCTTSSDCNSGFSCVQNLACWPLEKKQIPAGDYATPCTDNSVCPEGQRCQKGFCLAPTGGCGCSSPDSPPPFLPPLLLILLLTWLALLRPSPRYFR